MLIKYNEFYKQYNFQERDVVGLPSGEVIVMSQQQITYFRARSYIDYKPQLKLPNGEIIVFENYVFDDGDKEGILDLMNAITWDR